MTRPPIFESYSSDIPPPGDEARPLSKPAIFGFVLSLLQCLPVLAGLGAVVLGIVGLVQIRQKRAVGKPLAIAAIMIGTLSVIVWGLAIGAVSVAAAHVVKVEQQSREFVEALAAGDLDRARGSASREVSDEKLGEWRDSIAAGDFQAHVMMWNFSVGDDEDDFDFWRVLSGPYYAMGQVQYRAKATSGENPPSRQVWLSLVREGDVFRVRDMTVKRAPTTLPIPEEVFEQLKELEKLEEMRWQQHPQSSRPAREND